ncbi:hypothetical protein IV203_000051 [Nitzschia inconspicua]|uniref:Uncharacterized protein n=1 Tax=Nitzschia inconspicua TaxID=303405 RepID=A0A9K3L5T0_9STRA|nr:hypothetical protein IV203_000051 [Nitzschia inconspicua]
MSQNTAPDLSLPTEDDVTVITGKSTSRPSAAKVWQETVVKLRFQSKDDLLTKDVSYLAFDVLNAIKQSFQTRISIKTNANKELHTIQAPTNDDDFHKLFRVSHRRGNKAKKIQSQSWIIFRICTDMTLATIRKEQTVHDALQRSHGNLVYYPWTEDAVRSLNLCAIIILCFKLPHPPVLPVASLSPFDRDFFLTVFGGSRLPQSKSIDVSQPLGHIRRRSKKMPKSIQNFCSFGTLHPIRYISRLFVKVLVASASSGIASRFLFTV